MSHKNYLKGLNMAVHMGVDKMRPFVGLGVIIRKDGKVVLGKRKNSRGEGTWGFPGGHLEYNEQFEGCATREVDEETGIKIKNIRFFTTTNDIMAEHSRHYVTLFLIADHESGEAELREPDKFFEWQWFSWDNLPQPLFSPIQNLLKQNIDPFNL